MPLSDKELRQKVKYARARLANSIADLSASDAHFAAVEAELSSRIDAATPPPPPPPPPVEEPPPEVPPPASTRRLPELPRSRVDISLPIVSGRVISVVAGQSIQAAINEARGGDAIVIQPGATYEGSLVLPKRDDRGWVTIMGGGNAPPVGKRVSPLDAARMPRLTSLGSNVPVIRSALGARGWRLIGLHVTTDAGATVGALISINGHDARTIEDQPSHIILDRMLVMGRPDQSFQRGVLLNGANVAVIDSHVAECHGKGFDSQAIIAWQGSGPYLIQNNFLEGSGENVMFGGADSTSVELMPRDIEIRRNHFFKPLAWKGLWLVKNLLEFKVGQRVLVEGNLFENCWTDGQTGFALLFKSTNQSGRAPWSETSDITLRGNRIVGSERGLSLAGKPETHPAVPMQRVLAEHNEFEVAKTNLQIAGVKDTSVIYNSWSGSSHILQIASAGSDRLMLLGNSWPKTEYGIHSSFGSGDAGLNWGAPGWISDSNAARSGIRNASIPSGTVILAAGDAVPAGVGADSEVVASLMAGVE